MRGIKNVEQTEALAFITETLSEMGWNDVTAEASAHTGITFKQGTNTLINITLYGSEWVLNYNNGDSSYTPGNTASRETISYTIYATAHGYFILAVATGYTTNMDIIITRDDDNITIIVKNSFTSSTANTAIVVNYDKATYQQIGFTSNEAINTSLANFVHTGEIGTDTACKYAFFMPLYQYNVEGILTINDIQYASNGYWCLSDE